MRTLKAKLRISLVSPPRPWPPPWWRRPRPARRTTGRRLQSACAPCRLVQHSTFCLQSLSKHKILHEFFGGNHKICRAGWDLPVSCRHGAFFAACPRRRQSRADPPGRKFKKSPLPACVPAGETVGFGAARCAGYEVCSHLISCGLILPDGGGKVRRKPSPGAKNFLAELTVSLLDKT